MRLNDILFSCSSYKAISIRRRRIPVIFTMMVALAATTTTIGLVQSFTTTFTLKSYSSRHRSSLFLLSTKKRRNQQNQQQNQQQRGLSSFLLRQKHNDYRSPSSSVVQHATIMSRTAKKEVATSFDGRKAYSNNNMNSDIVSTREAEEAITTMKINLHTITIQELEGVLKSWGFPKYRAKQILQWVRNKGVTSFDEMKNLPKDLRTNFLQRYATIGSLNVLSEQVSKDGTIKRAYTLHDNQIIESVLMPYDDGRYTACISSQAGCAMGCVFCATGQMGFARQLTAEEIFEQVALYDALLKKKQQQEQQQDSSSPSSLRVSNVVMMGMGEPLANYRNVLSAIRRMNHELGIGARKITISTVGVVPNIQKLIHQDRDLQVRLAISLHCVTDEERTKLLPANRRYGGLDNLMTTIREYTETLKRRITFEWALIENENDTPEVANQLGNLIINQYKIRRDFVHINVIPLNPTGGFHGSPSGRLRVNAFCKVLEDKYGISATPRVRRGIDIDAGCGQLKSEIEKQKQKELKQQQQEQLKEFKQLQQKHIISVGVYEDGDDEEEKDNKDNASLQQQYDSDDYDNDDDSTARATTGVARETTTTTTTTSSTTPNKISFEVDKNAYDMDHDDFEDIDWEDSSEMMDEVNRLISLVQTTYSSNKASSPAPLPTETTTAATATTTSITNEDTIRKAKKRRKKILKNLKSIRKLKEMKESGKIIDFNEEQRVKILKEQQLKEELESVEHNLQ